MLRGKSLSIKKNGKIKNNFEIQDLRSAKQPCIKLTNLTFSATVSDLKRHFKQFGKVCNVKLKKRKNTELTKMGFVYFNDVNAAKAAIKNCSGMDFLGKNVHIVWIKHPLQSENKKFTNLEKTTKSTSKKKINKNVKCNDDSEDYLKIDVGDEDKKECFDKGSCEDLRNQISFKKKSFDSNVTKNTKRGRIIVRNISFKATEEKLMEHFKEFGAISEITLLRKDDGKLVGCGFVQFEKKQSAIRAILDKSGKPFLGRPIVCDWALPKTNYLKQMESENKALVNNETINDVKIKEEPLSEESDHETYSKMKTEVCFKEEEEEEEKDSIEDEQDYFDEDNEDDDDIDYDDDLEDSDCNKTLFDKRRNNFVDEKKPKVISNDVKEGCTIFIKNIPFSATNEDLGKCMKQFGPYHYALVCIDKLTEHSRGTGFVKFKKKEDADKCLQASGSVTIGDQYIEISQALPRGDIKSLDERKKEKKVKDNRHLYLVKEGVIVAGSPAAKDVSVSDMEKRLKIERWKTQILRDLNMFVSNTRLIVYNVPPTWTDNQVMQLFKSHAGPGAYIKEARIMRDLRNVDAKGVGKSKEYAFVHFTEHEHALRALRSINNNPNIFTKAKRPIVTFSIENKAIHKIKLKRLQKSRKANIERQSSVDNTKHKHKHFGQKRNISETEIHSNSYSGLEAVPGNKKMRTKFNMRNDVTIHEENVRKEKHLKKMKKKVNNRNKKSSEPQPKKKDLEENDSFSRLVDKYKSKLISANSQKRWYE